MIDLFATIASGPSTIDNIVTLTSAVVAVLSVLGSLTAVLFFVFRIHSSTQANSIEIERIKAEQMRYAKDIESIKKDNREMEITLARAGIGASS